MQHSPLPNRLAAAIGRPTALALFLLAIGVFANPSAFAGHAFRVATGMPAIAPPLGDGGIFQKSSIVCARSGPTDRYRIGTSKAFSR